MWTVRLGQDTALLFVFLLSRTEQHIEGIFMSTTLICFFTIEGDFDICGLIVLS